MTVILASSTLLPFFHHFVPSRITLSICRRRADSRSSSAIITGWSPIGDLRAKAPRWGIRGLAFFFPRARHSTRLRSCGSARGKVRGRIWHVWFSSWENVRRGDVGHDGIPADGTMGTTTALSRQGDKRRRDKTGQAPTWWASEEVEGGLNVGEEWELEGWPGRCFDRAAYRLHFSSLSSPRLMCALRVRARVLVNNFYSQFDLWSRVIDIAAEVPDDFCSPWRERHILQAGRISAGATARDDKMLNDRATYNPHEAAISRQLNVLSMHLNYPNILSPSNIVKYLYRANIVIY